jgi:predicted Fe-S protein YdhL (DUF1289 family)
MRTLLLTASLLIAAPALAQDVPWFEANPAERQAVLQRCHDDHRLARQAICANAETAETRAYAKRLQRALNEPEPPSMLTIQAARRACARPVSERGLFADWCRHL